MAHCLNSMNCDIINRWPNVMQEWSKYLRHIMSYDSCVYISNLAQNHIKPGKITVLLIFPIWTNLQMAVKHTRMMDVFYNHQFIDYFTILQQKKFFKWRQFFFFYIKNCMIKNSQAKITCSAETCSKNRWELLAMCIRVYP